MVTGTIPLKTLISWSLVYEIVREGEEVIIYYYLPDGSTMLKISLDKPSIATLAEKRNTITTFLEQDITLSGTVLERWQKQNVIKKAVNEEWVHVS